MHSHYHRFHGYDYSKGGSMFTTFGLKGRPRLFGTIDHDRVVPSQAGEIALRDLASVHARFDGQILLRRQIIMPDHVHLRFTWQPGLENAIKVIGNFIGRFKQFSHYHIAGHAPSIWEEGYHDLICTSERMNRSVDSYIDNNALKWWLMHMDRSLMHVDEPFILPVGGDGEIWRAVGDCSLAAIPRLVAIRISRRVPPDQLQAVVESCAHAADAKGYTFISTFYSPGERLLFQRLAAMPDMRMVRLIPTFLDLAYRPHGDEPQLFARQRLLVLSRMADPAASPSRPELLDLNAIAASLATATPGGKAIYVKPIPGSGKIGYFPA